MSSRPPRKGFSYEQTTGSHVGFSYATSHTPRAGPNTFAAVMYDWAAAHRKTRGGRMHPALLHAVGQRGRRVSSLYGARVVHMIMIKLLLELHMISKEVRKTLHPTRIERGMELATSVKQNARSNSNCVCDSTSLSLILISVPV
mmetsp:Transcript_1085/g.2350  ORF Transcript_1085/g.2350 Transcript_1085/m.2350 type:complete len:144 (+) Transcript_1085:161-592(+)